MEKAVTQKPGSQKVRLIVEVDGDRPLVEVSETLMRVGAQIVGLAPARRAPMPSTNQTFVFSEPSSPPQRTTPKLVVVQPDSNAGPWDWS